MRLFHAHREGHRLRRSLILRIAGRFDFDCHLVGALPEALLHREPTGLFMDAEILLILRLRDTGERIGPCSLRASDCHHLRYREALRCSLQTRAANGDRLPGDLHGLRELPVLVIFRVHDIPADQQNTHIAVCIIIFRPIKLLIMGTVFVEIVGLSGCQMNIPAGIVSLVRDHRDFFSGIVRHAVKMIEVIVPPVIDHQTVISCHLRSKLPVITAVSMNIDRGPHVSGELIRLNLADLIA